MARRGHQGAELFPAEQALIVQLLVERVDVQEDAVEVRIRAEAPGGGTSATGREESGLFREFRSATQAKVRTPDRGTRRLND